MLELISADHATDSMKHTSPVILPEPTPAELRTGSLAERSPRGATSALDAAASVAGGYGDVDSLRALDARAIESLRPLATLLYQVIDACVASRVRVAARDGEFGQSATDRPRPDQQPKNVQMIVDELLAAKREDGLSERYLQTIRSHLRRFGGAFNQAIASITTAQIEEWLRAQTVGPRGRNNIRGSVVTLFHFARKRGYLPKAAATEADDTTRAKDRGGKIGVLKPAELRVVLDNAPAPVALFIALGAFTGMRSSEMLRLDWRDVNLERSFITVAAEKAKTATRRLVPIQPNLSEWLSPYRGRRGALFTSRRDAARAIDFAKERRVQWPNNALRHSYATYRLAATADAARVALEMGNSPQKLMTNYRELADEKEALAWFSISPYRPKNVLSVSATGS